MIEVIYKITCDHCKERSQQNKMPILSDFVKLVRKIGWMRIDAEWWCPFCVRPTLAERSRKVRSASARPPRLSKTAREALAQHQIDEELKED